MEPAELGLTGIDWPTVRAAVVDHGWAYLPTALPKHVAEALEAAAPDRWLPVAEDEGGGAVRQAGLSSNSAVAEADEVVRRLATVIETGMAGLEVATPVPAFNHAQWSRTDDGRKFITPHRDPRTAGGVIAIATLRGQARFRVWELPGGLDALTTRPEPAGEWVTGNGDLVLLRGGDWPAPGSVCPIHEAGPALGPERVTLTLRHNTGGYGADYFTVAARPGV